MDDATRQWCRETGRALAECGETGRELQYQYTGAGAWMDWSWLGRHRPSEWLRRDLRYRCAPEPRYRQYTAVEAAECLDRVTDHGEALLSITSTEVELATGDTRRRRGYGWLVRERHWLDTNEPCGVRVEEG